MFEEHAAFMGYCGVVVLCGMFYTKLGVALTRFEKHATPADFEFNLVVKLICFQFFNYFSYFFYIAFWLRDMERLHDVLLDWMIVKTVLYQVRGPASCPCFLAILLGMKVSGPLLVRSPST